MAALIRNSVNQPYIPPVSDLWNFTFCISTWTAAIDGLVPLAGNVSAIFMRITVTVTHTVRGGGGYWLRDTFPVKHAI